MTTTAIVFLALFLYSIAFLGIGWIGHLRYKRELAGRDETIDTLLNRMEEKDRLVSEQMRIIEHWKEKYSEADDYNGAALKDWERIKREVTVSQMLYLSRAKDINQHKVNDWLNDFYRKFGKEVILAWGRLDIVERKKAHYLQLTLHHELYEGQITDNEGTTFSKKDVYNSARIAESIRKLANQSPV